jgi:anti-sigma B factor antagonist
MALRVDDDLRRLVEKGEKRVLLNLAEVSSIDSSGLGELVGGYTTLERNGGEMKLMHLTDSVAELMMITKLLTVFDVFENEEIAVASFGSSSSETAA